MCCFVFFVFFFKQKTAYEIYQCDWSSDVCSSDLMRREKLEDNALRIGSLMKARLEQMKEKSLYIGDVRGKGLVMGVELVKDKVSQEPAPELTRKMILLAAANGLLIGSVGIFGNVIRVAPPLVITEAEAQESLDIFEKALSQL